MLLREVLCFFEHLCGIGDLLCVDFRKDAMPARNRKRSRQRKIQGDNKPLLLKNRPDLSGRVSDIRWTRMRVLALSGVVLLALVINLIGLDWGRCGNTPWESDAIEGSLTVGHMQLMFKKWQHKYPRGHYIINGIFYYPLLKHWENSPIRGVGSDGGTRSFTLDLKRLDFLAAISRWIVLVMSLGTMWAVFLISRYLFGDFRPALLAVLTLAVSQLFVFFSKVGCVDIPAIFWLTWATYFAVRAVYEGRRSQYILMGFCAAYTFCTKEGSLGYVLGLGLATWVLMSYVRFKQGGGLKKAVLSVFSLKTAAAAAVFIGVFLLLNGFLGGPDEFMERVEFWTRTNFRRAKKSQWVILNQTWKDIYFGLGWPLFVVTAGSIIYFAYKNTFKLLFFLLPLIVFYLSTVTRLNFIVARYLMPAYIGFSIIVGKSLVDLIRWKKAPAYLSYGFIGIIYGLSLLYCVGLSLEMRSDTRKRTEDWFLRNVSKNATVGTGMSKNYAPHLYWHGYRQIFDWNNQGNITPTGKRVFVPDYLVLSDSWPVDSRRVNKEFMENIGKEGSQYEYVASFKARYVPPARTVFGIAGWPMNKHGFLSPPMYVARKKSR